MNRQHEARMRDFLAISGLLELPDCCPHWEGDATFLPGYCTLALGVAMARGVRSDEVRQFGPDGDEG